MGLVCLKTSFLDFHFQYYMYIFIFSPFYSSLFSFPFFFVFPSFTVFSIHNICATFSLPFSFLSFLYFLSFPFSLHCIFIPSFPFHFFVFNFSFISLIPVPSSIFFPILLPSPFPFSPYLIFQWYPCCVLNFTSLHTTWLKCVLVLADTAQTC